MSAIVIIPARGSSKRVPRKNIRLLAGRPLLEWTIIVARKGTRDVPVIVSTEDDEIATVARNAGAEVVARPAALAKDDASTEAVLLHVLDARRDSGFEDPDWVACLPPTSPFRRIDTLRQFMQMTDKSDVDCLLSVTETRGDFWHPQSDGNWERLFPDAPRRQQDRDSLFEENSAYYMTRISSLRETGSILGHRRLGVPIDPIEAMDINTPNDLVIAEALVTAGLGIDTALMAELD